MLGDSINIAIVKLVPATIVGLLAMETAYNQLLVVSILVLTLDKVDLLLPKTSRYIEVIRNYVLFPCINVARRQPCPFAIYSTAK